MFIMYIKTELKLSIVSHFITSKYVCHYLILVYKFKNNKTELYNVPTPTCCPTRIETKWIISRVYGLLLGKRCCQPMHQPLPLCWQLKYSGSKAEKDTFISIKSKQHYHNISHIGNRILSKSRDTMTTLFLRHL